MKKVIFLFAALLAVFSGIAAVTAFEGHVVDIKAHVENAIGVTTPEIDFGTVFPEEIRESNINFGLSNSFTAAAQVKVSTVLYKLYWELKPAVAGIAPVYVSGAGNYFQPMSPFLVASDGDPTDANDTFIAPPYGVPTEAAAVQFGAGELNKNIPETGGAPSGDLCDVVHIKFMVPVFDKWYNALTDPGNPAGAIPGILTVGQYVTAQESICGGTATVPSADLGINMKIQVIGFGYH